MVVVVGKKTVDESGCRRDGESRALAQGAGCGHSEPIWLGPPPPGLGLAGPRTAGSGLIQENQVGFRRDLGQARLEGTAWFLPGQLGHVRLGSAAAACITAGQLDF